LKDENLNKGEENLKTNKQIEESISFISQSPVYKQKLEEYRRQQELKKEKAESESQPSKTNTKKKTSVKKASVKVKAVSSKKSAPENKAEDIVSDYETKEDISSSKSNSKTSGLPEFDYKIKENKTQGPVSHEKLPEGVSKHEKVPDRASYSRKDEIDKKIKMIQDSISNNKNKSKHSYDDSYEDEFEDTTVGYTNNNIPVQDSASYNKFKKSASSAVAMKNRRNSADQEDEFEDVKPKEMSKSAAKQIETNNKSVRLTVILVAILVIALFIVYVIGYVGYKGRYLRNTFVNGVDIGGIEIGKADDLIIANAVSSGITVIKGDGEEVTFDGSLYGCHYTMPENANFGEEKHKFWFTKYFNATSYDVDLISTYSENGIRAMIKNYEWGTTEPTDARLEKNSDGTYEIIDEQPGDMIDTSAFAEYVIEQVAQGNTTISVDDADCYVQANITAEDLQDELDLCNATGSMTLTIDFNETQETIDSDTLSSWVSLDESGNLQVDSDAVSEYVDELSDKYNTYGKDRQFHATIDGDITVPWTGSSIYGWKINKETMALKITNAIKTLSKETISPSFSIFGYKDYSMDDIGDTYIELDISEQHFWLYKNGEIVLEDDVVTGLASDPERVTPTGIFSVWEMVPGKYLGTYEVQGYHTWVDWWMQYTYLGIGFHDLTRSAYGGDIYLTDGSHGCVNLSKSTAESLYNSIEIGIPVVVHD
jgi:hypothetical protein